MRITKTHIFFDTLLLFMLVMSSGSVFFQLERNDLSYFLLALSTFVLIFMGTMIRRSIFNASLITLSFTTLLVLLNYILAPDIAVMSSYPRSYLQYGFHLLNILSCIIILIHFSNNRDYFYFLDRVRFVLRIILYHAIFSFFVYFIVKEFLFELHGGWEDKYIADTFYYFLFYDPDKYRFSLFGIDLLRNQGLFWEPGILQIYLNLLLFLEGLIFRRSQWILSLIIFAIITTYSTTGILIMFVLLVFIYMQSIRKNPILIILACSILIPLYFITKTNLEIKTEGERSSSFQKRYLDLVAPIAIASDYPLTGLGLDRQYFQRFRSQYNLPYNFGRIIDRTTGLERISQRTDKGSSNSLTYLMV